MDFAGLSLVRRHIHYLMFHFMKPTVDVKSTCTRRFIGGHNPCYRLEEGKMGSKVSKSSRARSAKKSQEWAILHLDIYLAFSLSSFMETLMMMGSGTLPVIMGAPATVLELIAACLIERKRSKLSLR